MASQARGFAAYCQLKWLLVRLFVVFNALWMESKIQAKGIFVVAPLKIDRWKSSIQGGKDFCISWSSIVHLVTFVIA